MCREGVFINPKKSGCIIALLLLITLGISVVNLRKYNTRLGEDEKIEQEVDTKEPELEVTEYKKDYSYVKDVYTREKLSQIIVDTCARWELNNREVLDEEEEDIFGTGDTTLIDIFELNIPTYKDYEYYVDDNKVNSVVNMVKNMSVKFDGMYDNADNVKLYVNGRFKWEENIKRWSGCIISNDEYYSWSMEIDKSDSVFIRYIGEVSSFSRPFNKKKIYVYV
ncbi:MAG: hypothetical protein PUE32_02410 [Clostridia bacterium]|nr:hypothetical protein [Clostridia bacterium]